jgi:predicted ATPase
MITRFQAVGYGCLKKVAVDLTPLHAFIGPSDSGKSTLLSALYSLGLAVEGKSEDWFPRETALFGAAGPLKLAASDAHGNRVRLQRERGPVCTGESWNADAPCGGAPWVPGDAAIPKVPAELGLGRVRLLRLDADALRQPSGLVSYTDPASFFRNRGAGLAGLFAAILGRGDESFAAIRAEVQRFFPSIRRIGVKATSPSEVEIEAELADGSRISAAQMSGGLLYLLVFLALPRIEGITMLLIEQPENGLHPSRIPDVIGVLRRLVDRRGIQVVLETHSPIVVNELRSEEVSVVTRSCLEEGTRLTAVKDTPMFDERARVYRLGELWMRHADGQLETALLAPRPDEAP